MIVFLSVFSPDQSHSWQPGIKNPYRGVVVWPVPENIEITVTLFKVKPTPPDTSYTTPWVGGKGPWVGGAAVGLVRPLYAQN